jgi:hypothetical protein
MRLLSGTDAAALLHAPVVSERLLKRIKNSDEPFEVYEGGHSTEGEFTVGPRDVIVLGDLRVQGALTDTNKADSTLLVVVGSVQARGIATLAEMWVTNDVTADVVYGNSLFDGALTIGGQLVARAVINDGHHFEVSGEWKVPFQIAGHVNATLPKKGFDTSTLANVLIDEVLESSQSIALPRMFKALRAGNDVIRRTVSRS